MSVHEPEEIVQNARTRLSPADLAKLRLPIPVTVDDECAQPLTGYLLRLPGQFDGRFVVRDCHDNVRLMFPPALRDAAINRQQSAAASTGVFAEFAASDYADARWFAEAYRVALKAER